MAEKSKTSKPAKRTYIVSVVPPDSLKASEVLSAVREAIGKAFPGCPITVKLQPKE